MERPDIGQRMVVGRLFCETEGEDSMGPENQQAPDERGKSLTIVIPTLNETQTVGDGPPVAGKTGAPLSAHDVAQV